MFARVSANSLSCIGCASMCDFLHVRGGRSEARSSGVHFDRLVREIAPAATRAPIPIGEGKNNANDRAIPGLAR